MIRKLFGAVPVDKYIQVTYTVLPCWQSNEKDDDAATMRTEYERPDRLLWVAELSHVILPTRPPEHLGTSLWRLYVVE